MKQMKPVVSALMVSLIVLLSGCDELSRVTVDVEAEAQVDGAGPLITLASNFGFDNFVSFDVSSSAEFENNDATKDNIGDAYVTMFKLEVVDPDSQSLGFIDGMEVFIGDGNADPIRVAYIDEGVDTNVQALYLTVYDDRDIGAILRSDTTEVTVEASGNPPAVDTTLKATIRFDIKLHF